MARSSCCHAQCLDAQYVQQDMQPGQDMTVVLPGYRVAAEKQLVLGCLHARVKDVMTALEHCFLLEVRSRLNFATMLAIYKSGFTRIPVYEASRQNIKGILYVKDLILVDPDDETELSAVLAFRCATSMPGFLLMVVWGLHVDVSGCCNPVSPCELPSTIELLF